MEASFFPVNAMAPLYMDGGPDASFRADLELARAAGMRAISVDVWWSKVKPDNENSYDWTYYDELFRLITDAGLNIVPIMSFHEFGFDEINEAAAPKGSIPEWVWKRFDGYSMQGLILKKDDFKYRSELGNVSTESVSLWADALFIPEYLAFMKAFEKRYAHLANRIDELNISCGPTGELRYPSYNYHDTWEYPHRGYLQCYSRLALIDFRETMIRKYGSVDGVGRAWDLYIPNEHSINLPESIDDFIWTSAYRIPYGLDLFEWYNKALISHGRRMIRTGMQGFSRQFRNIPLGIKIPGVHWNIANPHTPRISEIMAGVINTRIDEGRMAAGHGYAPIMDILSGVSDEREIILHFTCLEQDNRDMDHGLQIYSRARDLVRWVSTEAHRQQVTIKGENAMALTADEIAEWTRIRQAVLNPECPYAGFTLLRLSHLRHSPHSVRQIAELSQTEVPA